MAFKWRNKNIKAGEQMRSLALWLCLAALAGSAMAQVYTWTDANGKKHVGDAATRPRDKSSPEIKVPPAIVADRFEPRTASPPVTAPEPKDEVAPPVQLTLPSPNIEARKPSNVDMSKESCRAKWDAYDSGVSCFSACGKPMTGFRGRNNADCGHCQDAPMPRC